MGEIKFRIYDTLNEEYDNPSDVVNLSNGKIYEAVAVPKGSGLSAGLVRIHNQDRYIIEQWTGLKDKNGVEIYEGDIVEIKEETFCHVRFGHYSPTSLYSLPSANIGFYLEGLNIKNSQDGVYIVGMREDVKVVGNIHEVENETNDTRK